MKSISFTVDESGMGERIDKFLASTIIDFSRSYIQKLISERNIRINGKIASKNHKLCIKDEVMIDIPDVQGIDILPENIPLDIFYEDNDFLIVNKPKDMVVHPAPGNYSGTLVNALLHYCKDSLSGINGVLRPGIVHRIDKDTSGLLIVAKNDFAHKSISEQIKNHTFNRKYEAIVYGSIKGENGIIEANIGRHKIERKKMSVVEIGGKNAITHYSVIKKYNAFTHLELSLHTGRTHQIRVHTAFIGHPVLGDEIYANPKKNPFDFLKGQCLHARSIGFIHPTTGKYVEFTSCLPEYFLKVLNSIEH